MGDDNGAAGSVSRGQDSIDVATAIVDSAPDALVCVNASGVVTLVNRQVERLFGYDSVELVGQPIEMLVPLGARRLHVKDRAEYFANPSPRPMGAGRRLAAVRKDGTEFPVDISLSSFSTEEGVVVLAAVRDISERLEIESERAALEARLVLAQREEERAVLEAKLHQAQRLETVGQLAGGVAHDFNNLLAGIMNYTALVAEGVDDLSARLGLDDDGDVRTIRQDLSEITGVAQRAVQLTRQLLIFSRREVVQPEVLDLNAIVTDMEKLLRRTIGEAIDLSSALQRDLPHVLIDRGQLEQVIMNLAVNARDAMPQGGILRIETSIFEVDEEQAKHRPVAPGWYARLTVSDSGLGMAPEVRERALEPFFSTKEKGKGSGLGLATVYGIVTQAAGDIVIYSEPGLGTTVRVLLPLADEREAIARPAPSPAPIGRPNETILLVEDEEIVREPTRRILERHGYTVLSASNADDAVTISKAHAGQITVLLTDVVMPGRSGKELAAEMEQLRPGLKVLFMSGYGEDVIVHQGFLEEGITLIEKPFSADQLLRGLAKVVDSD